MSPVSELSICASSGRAPAPETRIDYTPSGISGMLDTARSAQIAWAHLPVAHRTQYVRKLRGLIAQNAEELALASASPRSRPALESMTAEVLPLAEACRFLEREAATLLKPKKHGYRGRPLWLPGVRSEIHREPLGVILIIAPANYPLLLPGVQLIQSLVAGNAVLLKPGIGGAAAARALLRLVWKAGFDPGLVRLLPDSEQAARDAINAGPDKVLFTGSAATGAKILEQLAPRLIPATMELSGSDAVIVREDADLNLVAKALAFSLRLNNGLTCMAPKRVYVQNQIAAELEQRLVQTLRGNPSDEGSTAAQSQYLLPRATQDRLTPLLKEVLAQGAYWIAGDIHRDGSVLAPLVLCGVSPRAQLLREDVFGPVLALVSVNTDQEAIERANDSLFALGASVFSRDETAARTMAADLHAGVVTVNDLILPTADARLTFGGRKRSGFGVTRGTEGLLELTTPKVVTISRSRFRPAFDAPHPGDMGLFEGYLNLTHGQNLKSRLAGLKKLIQGIFKRNKLSPKEKL